MASCENVITLTTNFTYVYFANISSVNYTHCPEQRYTFAKDVSHNFLFIIELLCLGSTLVVDTLKQCQLQLTVQIGASLAQSFCENETPYPFYSTTHPIQVIARHTQDSNHSSFVLKARLIYTQDRSKSYEGKHCRHTPINDRFGVISTLNYPYGYQADTKCTFRIKLGASNTATLFFMDFMLTSYGAMCNNLDDNIRVRVSDQFSTRFEYAVDISKNQPYRCGAVPPFILHVRSHEYILIQFNSYRSTVAHRGFVVGYRIQKADNNRLSEQGNSSSVVTIGVIISLSVVVTASLSVTVYISKKKCKIRKTSSKNINASQHKEEEDEKKEDHRNAGDDGDELNSSNNSSSISVDISGGNRNLCVANIQRLNALFTSPSCSRLTLSRGERGEAFQS